MSFASITGKTIDQAFAEFDARCPEVYEHYKRFAFDWLATGAQKISSKQILGRIRWFVEVETRNPDTPKDFKINDAFTSRYVRKFIQEFPEQEDRFELRELRSGGDSKSDSKQDIYEYDTTFKMEAA